MEKKDARIGTTYYGKGLNMWCRPVLVSCVLEEILVTPTATGFDCIILSDGVRGYSMLSKLYATAMAVPLEGD